METSRDRLDSFTKTGTGLCTVGQATLKKMEIQFSNGNEDHKNREEY